MLDEREIVEMERHATERQEVDAVMDAMLQDAEFRELFTRKVREMRALEMRNRAT